MQHKKAFNGFYAKFGVQNFILQLDAITFSGIFVLVLCNQWQQTNNRYNLVVRDIHL